MGRMEKFNETVLSEKMVASDVVPLFPSMEARETARVCGKMVEKSELQVENQDYTEMLLYLQLNRERIDGIECLEPFFPTRSRVGGQTPSMKMEQVKGPHHQSEISEEKLIEHTSEEEDT